MDKLERLKKEIERRRSKHSKAKRIESALEDNAILSIIDSLEEEPVSIWHDANKETPTQGSNILMIRKEEGSDFPPIAGCFHGTNLRLDGRNWGYYNGFCYNEIEPPLKWAYIDDILNLSNVERAVKSWKGPVSEDLEQAAKAYSAYERSDDTEVGYDINRYEGFIAGANWHETKET